MAKGFKNFLQSEHEKVNNVLRAIKQVLNNFDSGIVRDTTNEHDSSWGIVGSYQITFSDKGLPQIRSEYERLLKMLSEANIGVHQYKNEWVTDDLFIVVELYAHRIGITVMDKKRKFR